MAKVEPYVRVTEIVKDTPNIVEVSPGAAIGVTIVSPAGPQLARITSDEEFLKTFTKDGQVPRNAHISFINAYYLSFVAELIVARSMNSKVTGGLAVYASTIGANATLSSERIYFKDGVELENYYTITVPTLPQTVPMNPAQYTDDYSEYYWGVIIDDVLYYGGDIDLVLSHFTSGGNPVDVSNLQAVACDQLIDEESSKSYTAQVLDYIASEINKDDELVATVGSNSLVLYVDKYTNVTLNEVMLPDEEGVLVNTSVICTAGFTIAGPNPVLVGVSELTRILTINSKTPGSVGVNPYSVKFSKTRNLTVETGSGTVKSIVFDLTIDGDTFVVSFDQNAVDSSGVNCFIETLNTQDNSFNFDFKVSEIPDLGTSLKFNESGPWTFGEGFIDEDSSKSIPYLKSALNVLDDQEIYDIRYLAPCGITTVPYVKSFTALGLRRKWFAPTDIPYDRTNAKSISAYTSQIQDSYNDYMIGPFDKNTGLTGWMVYIAATTLYWERVMNNRANNMEFAPVYEKNTGVLAYTNPVKLMTKSQREKLLSLPLPVNYVVYDERNNRYYVNDNWTHYSQNDNVMGEEQNVRMAHMISLDVQSIMENFKAKINNDRYRNLATSSIDNYFKNRLMTQEYKPDDYIITCNESNNPPEVIKARQMKVRVQVRYYNSTKYIDVINESYAVGGAEFEA